ncbi:hypothetical protein JL720_13537 [Aureococcus anophagefferens]|nr:hypothetical protein JL720_13537 [Aureococcus anophagefferens]
MAPRCGAFAALLAAAALVAPASCAPRLALDRSAGRPAAERTATITLGDYRVEDYDDDEESSRARARRRPSREVANATVADRRARRGRRTATAGAYTLTAALEDVNAVLSGGVGVQLTMGATPAATASLDIAAADADGRETRRSLSLSLAVGAMVVLAGATPSSSALPGGGDAALDAPGLEDALEAGDAWTRLRRFRDPVRGRRRGAACRRPPPPGGEAVSLSTPAGRRSPSRTTASTFDALPLVYGAAIAAAARGAPKSGGTVVVVAGTFAANATRCAFGAATVDADVAGDVLTCRAPAGPPTSRRAASRRPRVDAATGASSASVAFYYYDDDDRAAAAAPAALPLGAAATVAVAFDPPLGAALCAGSYCVLGGAATPLACDDVGGRAATCALAAPEAAGAATVRVVHDADGATRRRALEVECSRSSPRRPRAVAGVETAFVVETAHAPRGRDLACVFGGDSAPAVWVDNARACRFALEGPAELRVAVDGDASATFAKIDALEHLGDVAAEPDAGRRPAGRSCDSRARERDPRNRELRLRRQGRRGDLGRRRLRVRGAAVKRGVGDRGPRRVGGRPRARVSASFAYYDPPSVRAVSPSLVEAGTVVLVEGNFAGAGDAFCGFGDAIAEAVATNDALSCVAAASTYDALRPVAVSLNGRDWHDGGFGVYYVRAVPAALNASDRSQARATVTCVAPAGASSVAVRASNDGAAFSWSGPRFLYRPPLALESFAPLLGSERGGTVLTLVGSGFHRRTRCAATSAAG